MSGTQLPDSNIWFVRAERANVLADYFLDNGIVALGWGIGPVGPDDSKNEILGFLETRFPEENPGTLETWVSQIKRFNQDMETGDAVATCEPSGRTCHIGIIRDLRVQPDPYLRHEWESDHVHRIEWLYQVPRDNLSEYTQRRLSLKRTLHRLNQQASAELRHHCSR